LYEWSKSLHSQGVELAAANYPAYFQALKQERTIAIHDAHTDPRAKEFSKSYLSPLGITSMLDAPVWLDGEMVGVVCHEHVGAARQWALEEQNFAGSIADLVSMAMKACDRQQAEEARLQLASIVESSDDAIISKTLDGIIVSWNSGAERIYGYSAEEVKGCSVSILIPRERPNEEPQILARIKQGEHIEHYETVRMRKDGKLINVSLSISPIKDAAGKIIGVSKIARDITQRKRAEEALRESQARFAGILDIAGDAIISVNATQRITLFNQGAEKIFGYTAAEVLGQPLDLLLPSRFHRVHSQHVVDLAKSFSQARKMGERCEIFGYRKNGTEFPAEASISKLDLGEEKVFTVILRDITQRKQAEEKIKASLKEKEVLLKEIHHRVKNNLQIVSSLLKLQSSYSKDPQALEMFKESQSRIRSMALIHEKLYQSQDLSKVSFAEYIGNLAANLFRSYEINSTAINLKINVENIFLEIDVAVPCGLIINELISNSLKYAFPDESKGKIQIDLYCDNEREITLIISDNGIGLPKDFDFQNPETLGLQLVNNLVEQLEGTIEINGNNGTEFKITFTV
jgi:PAS domain S-box-containing protein